MNHKTAKIAALIAGCEGQGMDPHYAGFFECFNRELYFEAHEVLEELWLDERHAPDGNFYKGLIQFAGAFVHLQRNRPGPAVALYKLARANLERYPAVHHRLDVRGVLALIADWRGRIEEEKFQVNPFRAGGGPRLLLEKPAGPPGS